MKHFLHNGLYNHESGYIQSIYTNKYKYPKLVCDGHLIRARALFTEIFNHQSTRLRAIKYFYNRLFILEVKCALLCEEEGNFQDLSVRRPSYKHGYRPALSGMFTVKITYNFRRNRDVNHFINHCSNVLADHSINLAEDATIFDILTDSCKKEQTPDLLYYVSYVNTKLFAKVDPYKVKGTVAYKKYIKK